MTCPLCGSDCGLIYQRDQESNTTQDVCGQVCGWRGEKVLVDAATQERVDQQAAASMAQLTRSRGVALKDLPKDVRKRVKELMR